jgi:hypothetical protein
MALCGEHQIRLQLDHLEQFRLSLPDWLTCPVSGRGGKTLRRDPLRLVLAARDWRLAFALKALARHLSDDGIDIEFADLTRLVLIFSLWQSPDDWQNLTESLRRFPVLDAAIWPNPAPGCWSWTALVRHRPNRTRHPRFSENRFLRRRAGILPPG